MRIWNVTETRTWNSRFTAPCFPERHNKYNELKTGKSISSLLSVTLDHGVLPHVTFYGFVVCVYVSLDETTLQRLLWSLYCSWPWADLLAPLPKWRHSRGARAVSPSSGSSVDAGAARTSGCLLSRLSPSMQTAYASELIIALSVHSRICASHIFFICFVFHFMNKSITRLILYCTGLVLFIPFEFD